MKLAQRQHDFKHRGAINLSPTASAAQYSPGKEFGWDVYHHLSQKLLTPNLLGNIMELVDSNNGLKD